MADPGLIISSTDHQIKRSTDMHRLSIYALRSIPDEPVGEIERIHLVSEA